MTRNRLRRQLREIMRAHADALEDGHGYLVGVTDAAHGAGRTELARAVDACLAAHRG